MIGNEHKKQQQSERKKRNVINHNRVLNLSFLVEVFNFYFNQVMSIKKGKNPDCNFTSYRFHEKSCPVVDLKQQTNKYS